MSGFSAEWLALREPADHRARNPDLLAATSRLFAGRQAIDILDLGSGSGSNVRGLADHLPARQSWRLVDYDPHLIAAAKGSLAGWADRSRENGTLQLERKERTVDIAFQQADLSRDLDSVLDPQPDLVTAAAFFDLVSEEWLDRFAAALAARKLPLYTVLIYDGRESWMPPHPLDHALNAAFNQHQHQDKGFGPAAGPDAAGILAKALRDRGYEVVLGDSPWRLTQNDLALITPLADGIAQAVRETGTLRSREVDLWREFHRLPDACTIGHTDLLAIPPR